MSKTTILECQHVVKEYLDGDRRLRILNGIHLIIQAAEQVAIMGRSGSGKTTLLQMLGGLDNPSRGSVWLQQKNLQSLTEVQLAFLRNKVLGFVYQLHHLLPEFTALENVALPLLMGKVSTKEARIRAQALLVLVGLADRATHKPSALSGGERQRVAIARALINHPLCVLADEPTGNLDQDNARLVFELMRSLSQARGTAFVIVTHDQALAKRMDRSLILEQGQLLPITFD